MGLLGWDHIQPNSSVTGRIVGATWYAGNEFPQDGDWSVFIAPDNPDAYRNHTGDINPVSHKTWIHVGPIGSGDPPDWQKAVGLVECEVQPSNNDRKTYNNSFGAITAAYANGAARRATVYGFRCEDVSHYDKVEMHSLQYVVTEPDPATGEFFVLGYSDASQKGDVKPNWPPGAHNLVTAQVDVPAGKYSKFSEEVLTSINVHSHTYGFSMNENATMQGKALNGTVSIGSNGQYEARISLA